MPQTTQIIPKWTFPHVETYINDYTFVSDEVAPATVETSVETSSDTTTYAAVTEWRYKVINGYVYKRLYDKTNKIWLTDWIPC